MRIFEIDPGEKQSLPAAPNYSEEDIQKFTQLVSVDCSQYISALKIALKPLVRGFNSHSSMAFKGRSRDSRITYTDPEIVKYFNEAFAEAGIIANRTNTISTSTNVGEAGMFGTLYYLFPIDGFKFSWSPKIEDFGSAFGDTRLENLEEVYPNLMSESPVEYFHYTNGSLPEALHSRHEISIHGEYYAFRMDEPFSSMVKAIML